MSPNTSQAFAIVCSTSHGCLKIHDWIHDWNCEFMTGGLILINLAQGGWGSHSDALNQIG